MKLQYAFSLAWLVLTTVVIGCNRSTPETSGPTGVSESVATRVEEEADAEEELAAILEPFDAPSLSEVESTVTWVDLPVLDGIELRHAEQADQRPLVTVQEALRTHNDSPDNNNRILSALGRLPESPGDVNHEATLVKHLSADVKTVNPIMASTMYEFDLVGFTGLNLFGFDWELRPFALSEYVVSWQTSEDRTIDKIVMRDDIIWSDGRPVTAHDIVFSFQTIMNPKIPIPAMRAGTDQIRWIEAYDDHTLLYFHKESSPVNVWNVNFAVIPQHIYQQSIAEDVTLAKSEYHQRYEREPICGGPYKLVKRERGQELVLERREDWYLQNGEQVRRKPFFKHIRLRVIEDPNTMVLALKAGEIDECELTAETWTTQTTDDQFYSKNTKSTGQEWTEYHICWNLKTKYFSDVRVRKAMSYAFDYKEMLESHLYGLYQPANGPFHPDAWMAPKTPPPYYTQDLDRAEELLDEAGWEDSDGDGIRDKRIGGELVPFEFRLLCGNHPNPIRIGEILRENLDRIGVTCEVRPVEVTVWQQSQLDHKFHASLGGWGTGADPDLSINVFGTGENRNYGQYSNKEVDELFKQTRKAFDREERAELFGRIHEIMYEDQPYTWLYYRNSFYAFNKRLRGYKFSPRGPYHYTPGVDAIWEALAH